MIKVVFLDVDNTLLSFSGYVKHTMKEGFAHFGLKPYEEWMYEVFQAKNDALWKEIEQGSLTFQELLKIRWNIIFKELEIPFDGQVFEDYFREKLFSSAIPEEGAMEMLDYLHGKYTLCIASNGPYEQQKNRLRVGKMDSYFTHQFISEKIGSQKPQKEFFDACFQELRESGFPDLQPEETMIVGDSMSSDISGGITYGMHTCYYQKNRMPGQKPDGVDYMIHHLREIKNIL